MQINTRPEPVITCVNMRNRKCIMHGFWHVILHRYGKHVEHTDVYTKNDMEFAL